MAQRGDPHAGAPDAATAQTAPVDLVAATQRARRLEALASLVPPLAHKLNNALGGAVGLADLVRLRQAEDARGAELCAAAQREANTALDLVRGLGRFARFGPVAARVVEPADVLERAAALLEPLAQAHGVTVELRPPPPATRALDLDGGLEAWLLVAASELLGPAPAPGAPAGPLRGGRLRLAGRAGPAPWVTLVAAAPPAKDWISDGPAPPPWEREWVRPGLRRRRLALEPLSGRTAAPGPARSGSSAPASSLVPSPQSSSKPSPGRGARVALLEREASLAELVAMVLAEAGHRVRAFGEPDALLEEVHAGEADLILVASGCLDGPGLGELAEAAGRAARIALLGTFEGRARPAQLAAAPSLPKPFRPAELLAFVDGALGPDAPRPRSSGVAP